MSSNKRVLGRGLGNLLSIESSPQKEGTNGVIEIPISQIVTNPNNPRKKFDQTSIEELASTIQTVGILQPVIVSKLNENEYMLISGERRLRACRFLNRESIPCIINNSSDENKLAISLIENIQREQLDAIEEGMVYKEMLEQYNLTQDELSLKVGKNRATIANRMRLLQLPLELQAAVADGRLSEGQVRPILGIKDEVQREKITKQVLSENLTSRQIEDLVRKNKTAIQSLDLASPNKKDPNIRALESTLEEHLNTRVVIQHNQKRNDGKIIIDYFTLDDFERIQKVIMNLKND